MEMASCQQRFGRSGQKKFLKIFAKNLSAVLRMINIQNDKFRCCGIFKIAVLLRFYGSFWVKNEGRIMFWIGCGR